MPVFAEESNMTEISYLQELLQEADRIDQSFVHSRKLLLQEISRIRNLEEHGEGKSHVKSEYNGEPNSPLHGSMPPNSSHPEESLVAKGPGGMSSRIKRPGEYVSEEIIKLTEKVFVPAKEFPKFNFVGKLLGPRGNTLKRLQAQTGTKMSVLGKGSMRDKEKEDELRDSGDPKYAHLSDPLHVLIEVEGIQSDAHLRLAGALSEIKKYMTPENDEIRVQQMQEMAYLQSLENPESVPPMPPQIQQIPQMTAIPITLQPVARGRSRPILRGAPVGIVRGGARGGRGGKPVAIHPGGGRAVQWVGVRMPLPARGVGRALVTRHAIVPQRRQSPAQSQRSEQMSGGGSQSQSEQYESYEGAYDATYDATYDQAYAEGGSESVYYDYSGAETYEYAPTSSANFQQSSSYKAQPVRHVKRSVREASYPY